MDTIIIHPGPAHRDDVLAAACLKAHLGAATIIRGNPVEEDLRNPDTYVIDCGREHNTMDHNFDHHQYPRDAEPACALSLLNEHYNWGLEVFDWYEHSVILDARGPKVAAEHFGMTGKQTRNLISPIEETILQLVGNCTGALDTTLSSLLTVIGESILNRAYTIQCEVSEVMQVAAVVTYGSCSVLYPASAKVYDTTSLLVAKEAFEKVTGVTIAASISKDARGAGWSLYRYDNHAAIDFALIKGDELVEFAHAGGFVAKTKALCIPAELDRLVRASIVT